MGSKGYRHFLTHGFSISTCFTGARPRQLRSPRNTSWLRQTKKLTKRRDGRGGKQSGEKLLKTQSEKKIRLTHELRNAWKILWSGGQKLRLIHARSFDIFFDNMIAYYRRRGSPQKGEFYTKASRAYLCGFCFTAWGLFLTCENQLYYEASDRAPASRNQAASPLSGVG